MPKEIISPTMWATPRLLRKLGVLYLLLHIAVASQDILIWSQHSHLWTKLRGIYGPTEQWLQASRRPFVTSESARNSIMNSLAYDHQRQFVYWHDSQANAIYRQPVNDSLVRRRDDNRELVYEKTAQEVSGLAVDWLTENVFWVERSHGQIRMTRKHSSATDLYRIVSQQNLPKPQGIAVDPVQARLYFSTNDETQGSFIESSGIEGNDRRQLVQVGPVTALTLDLSENSIFFIDSDGATQQSGRQRLRKLDLRTNAVQDIVSLPHLKYPGIAAHGSYIYLVNEDTLEVEVRYKDGTLATHYVIDAFPHDIVVTQRLGPEWTPPTDCDCGDFCVRLLNGATECRCRNKYYFRLDGKSCISSEPRFIYSIDGNLYDATVDISLPDFAAELTTKSLTNPGDYRKIQAIGFHFKRDIVHFSDTELNDIYRLDVSGRQFTKHTVNEYNVEGLAVSWLSDTVYWSDTELRHIMLSQLDGRYHRILLEDVGVPRGITVDSISGYLFFVNAETSSIERVYTDGRNQKQILTGLNLPQSVVVDPRSKRIYWIERGSHVIQSSDFEGQQLQTAHTTSSNALYGVSVFQEFVTWTQSNEDLKLAKIQGQSVNVMAVSQIAQFRTKTYSLVTYDYFLQPEALGRCVANGGCQQLCFPTPDGDTCACAIGYKLAEDGRTCNSVLAETNFILFMDPYHKALYQLDIKNNGTPAVPIDGMDFPVTFDLDPENGRFYWFDRLKRSFRSSYSNGFDEKEVLQVPNDHNPVRLVFDKVAKQIFFVDNGPGKQGIYSLKVDGSGQLKTIKSALIDPSDLAVDPASGRIYFAEKGTMEAEAAILSIKTDGTDLRTLLLQEVSEPVGVSYLPKDEMLFWADKAGSISSYNVSSQEKKTIYQNGSMDLLSITADEEVIYFTAHSDKRIYRLPWREAPHDARAISGPLFARIFDIKAYPGETLIPPPGPVIGEGPFPIAWVAGGIAAAVLLALLLLLLGLCLARRKKPHKETPPTAAVVSGTPAGFDEPELGYIGMKNPTVAAVKQKAILADPPPEPSVIENGIQNSNFEPDYENVGTLTNGGHVTESAPQLSMDRGFDASNVASQAAMVLSTGQLRTVDRKYQKNKQPAQPDPNTFDMQNNGKVATLVQRLAKRLRTGISSIRWTNGEDNSNRRLDMRDSGPPGDTDTPGEPDANPQGAARPPYAKKPPIGPFKPQLHRLPQGMSPASRITPQVVKTTIGRTKMKQRGQLNGQGHF